MKILVLNTGSSTYKLNLYHQDNLECLWEGTLDWKSKESPLMQVTTHKNVEKEEVLKTKSTFDAVKSLVETLWMGDTKVINSPKEVEIIGHRVVHGGDKFHKPVIITPEVKESIKQFFNLAPLHNPVNLEGIEIMEKIFNFHIPQVAVFDTSFHATMPEAAITYPGPYAWRQQGIRRYGFHGISHQFCSEKASEMASLDNKAIKIISCHLGNGSSLTAIDKGKSIDTTMGFTPLEGLMMGTRSGSVDPGILIYLLNNQMTPEQIDRCLNFESGLKGISGTDGDMRTVLQNRDNGDPKAVLAYDMYVLILKKFIGAMFANLGGVDIIVFTGGIGENTPSIRYEACQWLGFCGIDIDQKRNSEGPVDREISSEKSKVKVFVIHARENYAIAKACLKMEIFIQH